MHALKQEPIKKSLVIRDLAKTVAKTSVAMHTMQSNQPDNPRNRALLH